MISQAQTFGRFALLRATRYRRTVALVLVILLVASGVASAEMGGGGSVCPAC